MQERGGDSMMGELRAQILSRGTLILLALDVCSTMLPRAGRYGAAGFNVAHFAWLDALQPTPSPALYVSIMALVALLACIQAIRGTSLLLMGALFLLYTYGWAMSLLDSYQHHYLLSCVLFCFTVAAASGGSWRSAGPRLVPATLAIVYAFAAVSKLDGGWLSGSTLRAICLGAGAPAPAMCAWPSWLGTLLPPGAILFELLASVGFVAATRRDAPSSENGILFLAAWIASALLHGGAWLLAVRIEWFGAYAMLFATVLFVPARWLEGMRAATDRFRSRSAAPNRSESTGNSP
jgi:hypothetical protein